MNARPLAFALLMIAGVLAGCGDQAGSDLNIQPLPAVTPSLPEVPTLPPDPFPPQYEDNSYSVYGLRRRAGTTIDTDVGVTGYIVGIYVPPECPEGRTCEPPSAPHFFLADTRDTPETGDRLLVTGYADNQTAIDEAIEEARRNRNRPPAEPEPGMIPVPTDLAVGVKIKIQGRFTRMSRMGFSASNGVFDYQSHQILEPAPGAPPAE
jgi:hypothetical protein